MATHLQKTIVPVFDPSDGQSHSVAETYCGLRVPLSRVNLAPKGLEQYVEGTRFTHRTTCAACITGEATEVR